jgi:hypothetical protein
MSTYKSNARAHPCRRIRVRWQRKSVNELRMSAGGTAGLAHFLSGPAPGEVSASHRPHRL